MALAHSIKNTNKDYKCTNCSSDNVSVVREGDDPRLKCNGCNFMFNGSDSVAAQEAGAIKASSAEALADAGEPEISHLDHPRPTPRSTGNTDGSTRGITNSLPIKSEIGSYDIPNRPYYVFLAKDKTAYQFCSKADFKKVAIRWSQGSPFDVYELSKIKLGVKVVKE